MSDILGRLGDIFTGGLETALQIEAEKSRAEIQNKPVAADHNIAVQGDAAAVPRGQPSPPMVAGVPVSWVIAGGVVLVGTVLLWSVVRG